MDVLSTDTEQLIKDTAKRVFFKEGKLHATTQDIADAAGINRASIHYYYRSRKLLFDKVFSEALEEMHSKMKTVLQQDLPFRQLIEKFIEFFLIRSMEHPYLELFLIAELNDDAEIKHEMLNPEEKAERRAMLDQAINHEVAAGTMKPIKPEHFIVNLMSLCTFPIMAKPVIKTSIGLTEESYAAFIEERKQVILKLIFLDL